MAGKITVIGLGPGNPRMLTREAWEHLSQTETVYLRTKLHPVVQSLEGEIDLQSFDELYEAEDEYREIYRKIVEQLLLLVERGKDVVYAVPGDPSVGEATTKALQVAAATRGFQLKIIHGVSFVEPCLELLEIDALDEVTILDAIELAISYHPPLNPNQYGMIAQFHTKLLASDVKLNLMNQYPDEHQVILIHAAGTGKVKVERMPLYLIDQSESIGSTTTLVVPPLKGLSSFEAFQETVAHLRAPDGCPWDREQTHQSLRPHVLEEAYEVVAALDSEDLQSLKEELGDLLLQIVLQAQIATEAGEFQMGDVIAGINDKLIRRHPHVFADLAVEDVDQVLRNWEKLKAEERDLNSTKKGLLEGVPMALPALAQALELQTRAARVGFEWPALDGVLQKVNEELGELKDAQTPEEAASEIGDLIFAVVNYARWLKLDPEAELQKTNRKFRARFGYIEERARAKGTSLQDMGLEQMDAIWEEAKNKPDRGFER